MIANSIITERLKSYSPQSLEEENDSIKEILQEVILFGLSDSDFFEKAAFHGGSSLRILYGLPRFSEDLDFLLDKADRDFKSSGFAGKCHALLCRNYVKGRDWYDFIWYISQKVKPNLQLLASAIAQNGPWKNKNVHVQKNWLIENLEAKIHSIDWEKASQDVAPFLRRMEKRSLKVWGTPFFLDVMSKLQALL